MSRKILITGTSVRDDLLSPLREAGYTISNPTHLLSEHELKEELRDAVAYLLGGDEYASAEALSEATSLKIVAFLGVGYESFIDARAATSRNICVSNTPNTLTNAVAEYTVGMLLCGTRRLYHYAYEYARSGGGREEKQHELHAMHIGIVGLGAIGTRIAEILRAGFDPKLSYFSRTRKLDVEKSLDLTYMSLESLVSQVDAIIVMTPGNDSTRGLVDTRLLASCKPGLILINTARAEIVAPDALLHGLRERLIGYAAFDGFFGAETNDLEELKHFVPDRLMITGHIASLTHEARDGMAIKAVRSILNVLDHGHDVCVVNGIPC